MSVYSMLRSALLLLIIATAGCKDAITSPRATAADRPRAAMACPPETQIDEFGAVCDPSDNMECDDSNAYTIWYCATYIPTYLPGGPTGGENPTQSPPEDSVSYEEVVNETEVLIGEIESHLQGWETLSALRAPQRQPTTQLQAGASANSMLFTPETALDLVVIGYDIGEIVVAGPNAVRVRGLLIDLASTLAPGIPAPGSIRVVQAGGKAARTSFNRLQKLRRAAEIGREAHFALSWGLWKKGEIGASKILSGGTTYYIDGALINRGQRLITLIELKPKFSPLVTWGMGKFDDYVRVLQAMPTWSVTNKVTGATETFLIRDEGWTIAREATIRTYEIF